MTKTYVVDGAELVEEAPAVRVGFAVQTIFAAPDADALADFFALHDPGFPFQVLSRRTNFRRVQGTRWRQ